MVSVFSAIIQVNDTHMNKASFYIALSIYYRIFASVKAISTYSSRPPAEST